MPVLQNPRDELYCQYRSQGKTQVDAYELAGWERDDGNACVKDKQPHIQERIAELLTRVAQRVEKSRADIVLQLDHDRALAHDNGNASAAVSASMGQAKVLGHIVERKRVVFKDIDEMTREELIAFLGQDEARQILGELDDEGGPAGG